VDAQDQPKNKFTVQMIHWVDASQQAERCSRPVQD